MKKRYIFLAIIFLAVASGLLFLPEMKPKDQIGAKELLNDIHSSNRYLSTDIIAKRIINDDPMVFLVDVRTEKEYNRYHLPGSVNIPFDSVLNDDWSGYLNQDIVAVIFYSNDDILSEQAWVLCKQLGYPNLYVLDGGLNRWFGTIMLPPSPSETDPIEAYDLYSFRVGASIYFGAGSSKNSQLSKPKETEKKTIPIRKKVKRSAEGGC